MRIIAFILGSALLLSACSSGDTISDAYGNFETTEVLVSAEANGRIVSMAVDEGIQLKKGATIAVIDTTLLVIKKEQLFANVAVVNTKLSQVQANVKVLEAQQSVAAKELQRVEKMFADSAATQQMLDKALGAVDVIKQQIESAKTNYSSIKAEVSVLNSKIEELNEMVLRSTIKATQEGVVLQKLAEEGEMMAMGRPVVKIGDVNNMILRAYVSGSQLANIKLSQKATVIFDKSEDENQTIEGVVVWISPQAEFTPKIIQTKEERVDLVYAIKVNVKNDGRIKIGMPGEVKF